MSTVNLELLAAELADRVRIIRLEAAGIPAREAGPGVEFEHLPAIDQLHWRQLAQAAIDVGLLERAA